MGAQDRDGARPSWLMRCTRCGATNPPSAAWCNQCHRRFDEGADGPQPAAAGDGQPPARQSPGETAAEVEAADGGFRREGDEVQWGCPSCGRYNALDARHCHHCGTDFLERFRHPQPEPARAWGRALVLTAIMPGAGHIAVDRYGSGIARLVLFTLWLLGAVWLGQAAGSRALMVVTPLLLGALALWVGSLLDVHRLQQGRPEVLAGRLLLWLVVAVLVLLGMGVVASLTTLTASDLR